MAGAQIHKPPNPPSHYTNLATSAPTSPSYANDRVSKLYYKTQT